MIALRAFALTLLVFLAVPTAASAQSPTGGARFVASPAADAGAGDITVPGTRAKLLPDGTAAAPADAPAAVQEAIWAANRLQDKPYRYGGGHGRIEDSGYDCSGTISYALHHADLLESPLDSGSFMSWGERGRGEWITVYTNPGHAYAVIAGLRLDTSSYGVSTSRRARRVFRSSLERGPRWRPTKRPARGFVARHPLGF